MMLSSLVENRFPTAADVVSNRKLISYLHKADVVETEEGIRHRKQILSRLWEIVEDWSNQACEHNVYFHLFNCLLLSSSESYRL